MVLFSHSLTLPLTSSFALAKKHFSLCSHFYHSLASHITFVRIRVSSNSFSFISICHCHCFCSNELELCFAFFSFPYFSSLSLSLSLLLLHLFRNERIQVACILTTQQFIFSSISCRIVCLMPFLLCTAKFYWFYFVSLCCVHFVLSVASKAEPFYCMDFQQISCFTDLFACGNWKRKKSVLRLLLLLPNTVAAVVISQLECTTSGHDITSKIDSSARISFYVYLATFSSPISWMIPPSACVCCR